MSELQDMFEETDDFLFADEQGDQKVQQSTAVRAWKVVIADDDEEVHSLTRLVLSDFVFEGRGLSFISSYSGSETGDVLREHPDTALVLLDVVMEKDDAGLETVRVIRDELDNHFVRIILRTGQPGQAPEQEVVSTYDINDYKAKTELTAQKLSTTVTSALRSYRDIRLIERNRVGLEQVNELSRGLYKCDTCASLAAAALSGVGRILQADDRELELSGVFTMVEDDRQVVLAGSGGYADAVDRDVEEVLSQERLMECQISFGEDDEGISATGYCCRMASRSGQEGRLILELGHELDVHERELLKIFAANMRTAFENIHLNLEVRETQREMIITLGEIVESRSKETANHVKRVGRMAEALASLAGLDEKEAELLGTASPLHDVGKIAIPDSVLLKPGALDDEERRVMQRHASIGQEILKASNRELFQAASIIAHQHHERWDGGGYPRGLAGEDIHVYGRIVAVIDVFDALAHARVYKPAMPIEKCLDIIREERGKHFDPDLVDLLLANLDVFTDILEELRDDTVAEETETEVVEV